MIMGVAIIFYNIILANEISDFALDVIGIIVGVAQIFMAIFEIIALVFVYKQLKVQRQGNLDQNIHQNLSDTYQVMETRLLKILDLRYSIKFQLKRDIKRYFSKKGKDKPFEEQKKIMIERYLNDARYVSRYKNILELLNSYEYLCSAIEHKFINEVIIKEQHKDKLIETYEDYKTFIERDGKVLLCSFNNIYNIWKEK